MQTSPVADSALLVSLELQPLQMLPDGIGSICDKYVAASKMGWDILGSKRKVCNNKACATWRHRETVKARAKRVCQWIKHAPDELLRRVWVHLEGPPERMLTGYDIRRDLLLPSTLGLKMADALVQMFRALESETMATRTMSPGRHYVSPQWGVYIADGNSCMESSYEKFMSPKPPYEIKRCTTVLTLVCLDEVWSCYAFDLATNTITIMDPNGRHPIEEKRALKHTDVSKKMLPHLLHCMRKATGDPNLGHGGWTPTIMLGTGNRTWSQNSGIQAVNCMRWYNGKTVCIPPCDSTAPQTRRDLVYQLLAVDGNLATTDVFAESKKEEAIYRAKKKARGGAAHADLGARNSNTSSGNNNGNDAATGAK